LDEPMKHCPWTRSKSFSDFDEMAAILTCVGYFIQLGSEWLSIERLSTPTAG
jgi:hypothetical protein